jgi:glycogen synthase
MAKDFSWRVEAREYIRVYERVRQLHAQAILV